MHRNSMFLKNNILENTIDEKALNHIEYVITSNESKKIEELVNGLLEYHHQDLQKLCKRSQKFRTFCHSNAKYQEELKEILEESKYINVEITSMNGSEHVTIFDHYMASFFFGDYYENLFEARTSKEAKTLALQALDLACELGLSNALIARCQQNIKKIFNSDLPIKNKSEAIESILVDTKRLSNLYWCVGYVEAGFILQDTAKHYQKSNTENDRVLFLQEESIKNFLCASLLAEQPESKKIEKSLTFGQGILSTLSFAENEDEEEKDDMLEPKLTFHNWEEVREALWRLSRSNDTYERLLTRAKIEVDSIIKVHEIKPRLSP